jgi:hypothetical protein
MGGVVVLVSFVFRIVQQLCDFFVNLFYFLLS